MPTAQSAPSDAAPSHGTRRLLWHLAEMALAMVAGMVLLGPLWEVAGTALGVAGALARPEVAALVLDAALGGMILAILTTT
ncbi:hypothetical protein [Micromonospora sp. WMMD710]|uniref:hypothetical protein n=1 Tax=Micromonospora sp. WMMD710 TaxID=3016085 RepID=UPI002416168A|nr:hypothetical protein [Micromonospora sp. WMMD710]MDG4757921.1 hypothetical protein [Micromonospora sp. WMMD710]